MGKKSCRITLPVLAVAAAICYIYFTSVFVFLDHWFGLWSSPGLMNAVVFTAIAAMCVFNYAVAIFTDPGRVPPSFVPDIEDTGSPIQEIKRKGGDLRYCQKCSHYKPPRAHHCRVCKRCVLRMDHHCIWINNCVGHANYKIFFVFVLYAVLACLYSLVLLLGSIVSDSGKDEPQNEGSLRTIYVTFHYACLAFILLGINVFLCLSSALFMIILLYSYRSQVISCILLFPLTIALGVLLLWHIYLTLRNKTTIEYYEGVRAMWLAEKGGEVYRHPYDLGAFENLTSVLGPNIFSWICPTSGHIGHCGLIQRISSMGQLTW